MEYAQLESLNRVMEDEKKRKPSHMQEKDPRKRLPDPPFHGRMNELSISFDDSSSETRAFRLSLGGVFSTNTLWMTLKHILFSI